MDPLRLRKDRELIIKILYEVDSTSHELETIINNIHYKHLNGKVCQMNNFNELIENMGIDTTLGKIKQNGPIGYKPRKSIIDAVRKTLESFSVERFNSCIQNNK